MLPFGPLFALFLVFAIASTIAIITYCCIDIVRYPLNSRVTEPFTSHHQHPFIALMTNDSDGYVASFTDVDLKARGAQSKEEYIKLSTLAVREPTQEETERVRGALARLKERRKESDFTDEFAVAVMTDDRYEGGMPHTRGLDYSQTVFLTEVALQAASEAKLADLLAHELTHVAQRLHPERARAWATAHGYTPCSQIKTRQHHPLERANPDLDRNPWCIQTTNNVEERVAFIYSNRNPSGLRDGGITPNGANYEHPFEAEAYNVGSTSE